MRKYPDPYIQFLVHFHGDRDYFECHEILEDYWKATDARNKKSIWVALILLAVSNYHYRRNNFSGAKRTLKKALQIFESNSSLCSELGINPEVLMETLTKRENNINNSIPYSSFNLPVTDPELISLCQKECKGIGYQWGAKSDLNDHELVHRHSLRDRSDVISEREMALEYRNKKSAGEFLK